jgi:hypothetical protein
MSLGFAFYVAESFYQLLDGSNSHLTGYNYFIAIASICTSFISIAHYWKDTRTNACIERSNFRRLLLTKFSSFIFEPTLIIFIIAVSIKSLYGNANPNGILPDASLYLDCARFLASKGYLYSNVFNELYYPFYYQTGKINHMGTVLLFGSWFVFNDISYINAQSFMYIVSSVSSGLFFTYANTLFKNRIIAYFSVIISLLHPTLLFYSVILYGPEFISTLITILFLILLSKLKEEKFTIYVFLGYLCFLSSFVWGPEFYILIVLFFTWMITINGPNLKCLLEFFIFVGLSVVAISVSATSFLWFMLVFLYSASIFISFLTLKHKISYSLCGFGIVLLFLSQLIFIRTYAHPELILGPPYHPRVIPIPTNILSLILNLNLPVDLLNYYDLLIKSAGTLLLVGYFAFPLYKKRLVLPLVYVLTHSLLIMLLSKIQYVSSRFFITEIFILILCTSSVILYLVQQRDVNE